MNYNMKSEEKAKELFDKYYSKRLVIYTGPRTVKYFGMTKDDAKQCALIACDEILDLIKNTDWLNDGKLQFWQEVKTIITNY